jgi:hypothetical protein
MKKLSSYQKLKQEKNELYRLYEKARRKLHNMGRGLDDDDIMMDFDMSFAKVSEEVK